MAKRKTKTTQSISVKEALLKKKQEALKSVGKVIDGLITEHGKDLALWAVRRKLQTEAEKAKLLKEKKAAEHRLAEIRKELK